MLNESDENSINYSYNGRKVINIASKSETSKLF